MREIKFRAWDTRVAAGKPLKEMAYFELTGLDGDYIISSGTYLDGDYKLMQYTGLKDKNGKEIYEGDLIQDCKGQVLQIAWAYCYARYMASTNGEWCVFYLNEPMIPEQDTENMEVVGNIYENPELLKEE